MNDNNVIISFEEYRKKKRGESYKEDALSEVFKKDLREQTDLIDWYLFHNLFNKHKLFVYSLFYENHGQQTKNPNAGFVVAYSQDQIKNHTDLLIQALEWENRDYIIINAAQRTFRELGEMLTGIPLPTGHKVYNAFEDILLNTDKVIVIQEISKSKISYSKTGYARSLIKIIDDAHFKGISPKSDLIFIDYADFLQKSWEDIGIYLKILSS